jgi:hypothetical protein
MSDGHNRRTWPPMIDVWSKVNSLRRAPAPAFSLDALIVRRKNDGTSKIHVNTLVISGEGRRDLS